MTTTAARTWIAALLLATLAASCAKRRAGAPAAAGARPADTPARAEPAAAGDKLAAVDAPGDESGKARPTDARKIIRNGALRLQIESYEQTRQAIDDLVRTLSGYVASSQVGHGEGTIASAQLVLRLPAARFDEAVRRLAQLGLVLEESTRSEDVTEAYVDLAARLGNAQRLEARLLELVASKAGSVPDLLGVEQELARVREQIEVYQGKLRLYDNQVDLATLTVDLETRARIASLPPPSFGGRVGRALGDSWQALGRLAQDLVVAGAALLPWLPAVAGALWLALRLRRRRPARA